MDGVQRSSRSWRGTAGVGGSSADGQPGMQLARRIQANATETSGARGVLCGRRHRSRRCRAVIGSNGGGGQPACGTSCRRGDGEAGGWAWTRRTPVHAGSHANDGDAPRRAGDGAVRLRPALPTRTSKRSRCTRAPTPEAGDPRPVAVRRLVGAGLRGDGWQGSTRPRRSCRITAARSCRRAASGGAFGACCDRCTASQGEILRRAKKRPVPVAPDGGVAQLDGARADSTSR